VVQRVIVYAAGELPDPMNFARVAASILSTLVLHIGLICGSLSVH